MKRVKRFAIICACLFLTGVVVTTTGCSNKKKAVSSKPTKPSISESETTGTLQPSKKLQELRKRGVLRVGSSGDVYAYIDQKTGEFSGIDAEIVKEVAKRLGIAKVEMELMPFSELILNLTSGNIDMITDGMYVRAERAQKIYFGDIWYTQGGSLVVQNSSKINGISDFDPKTTVAGYTAGTAWQTVVTGWKDKGLIKDAIATGDQSESLIALQYGKIDAFLTDSTAIESLKTNSPDALNGLRMCTNYTDTSETLGRISPAVTFDNIDFMEEVNKVVYQLREEGFIDKAMVKCGLDPKLHMITNSEKDRVSGVNTR